MSTGALHSYSSTDLSWACTDYSSWHYDRTMLAISSSSGDNEYNTAASYSTTDYTGHSDASNFSLTGTVAAGESLPEHTHDTS